MSHWKVCCLVGLATLACARAAVAGTATFAGLGDEVPLEAEGLTKVQATADGYTLTGGSTSFTNDCTGGQVDQVAIHESVISQLNQDISDGLFESRDADWEITLQLDPSSAAVEPEVPFYPGSDQAWGIGIRFGNGTNQTTSPTGTGNFGRGADLIFGFAENHFDTVTFPMLIPYVLLVGADFSLNPEGQFFNFFNAVDFSFDREEVGFFQDFLGTDGKLVLRRTGLDEFGRPIIEIHSKAEGRADTWAWTAGNTGTPGLPVVNATGEHISNVNLNGLIPAESALPDSEVPLGMPVTSLYLFVENETTWVQYFSPFLPQPEGVFEDECFGTQPTPEQSETYAIDFDFPVDDPGEFDSNDTEGFQALLTGPRDDINSYGNVDEQRALPEGAGRFGCLTIVSDAIPDINPNSSCERPEITLHPESVTVDLIENPPPQNAEFTVEATGTGELTYQWLKNGVPIQAVREARVGNINAGIGGGRNAGDGTLEVTLLDESTVQAETWVFTANTVEPAAFFSAVGSVSGPSGTILATQGGLAFPVTDSLSVMIEQGAKPFEVGDVFRFTVAVDPVENETADEPTLVIADVTGADAGKYRALVTDEIGTASSNPAQLEVIEPIPLAARRWETYE